MNHERIDLRGLPTWERPHRVFEVFDRLPAGGALTFVTEYEPRGLSARIEQQRQQELLVEPRRVGEHEWHVTLTRTGSNGNVHTADGYLSRCLPFSTLSDAERSRVSAAATIHVARRGQAVVAENSNWPFLGVVGEGVLAIASTQSGRDRIFYEVFTNEVFAETELFDRALSIGRVSVLSKTATYVKIPRDIVIAVGLGRPRLLLELGEILAQRGRGMAAALATQATTPILARIAQALLPYAMPEEGLTPVAPTLLGVTQAQIAASAGTVKEVAARAIAELETRALLRRERGHIRYLNRQGLLDLLKDVK